MPEIKSTLELALERTQKITLSEKEKEEIREKELHQKTLRLFHRYKEGQLHLNEIHKEIERMEEKEGQRVKESLLSLWIDELSLDEDGEKLLKGIEILRRQKLDTIREAFHQLLAQYRKDRDKLRQEVESKLLEALRRKGIDGDAVIPNWEISDLWQEDSLRLGQRFQAQLEDIKEQLRSL